MQKVQNVPGVPSYSPPHPIHPPTPLVVYTWFQFVFSEEGGAGTPRALRNGLQVSGFVDEYGK